MQQRHSLPKFCDILDRAKLCRVKFSSGENICRAKFLSPNEKFATLAWRKISPNKYESIFSWHTSEPESVTSHLDKLWSSCRARFSSGEIYITFRKMVTFARHGFAKVSRLELNFPWGTPHSCGVILTWSNGMSGKGLRENIYWEKESIDWASRSLMA